MTELYAYRGHCVRVVDGDTLDLMVDLGFGVSKKIRVRLRGIDTPEIYGKTSRAEKKHGKAASSFAFGQLYDWDIRSETARPLIIRTHKDSKGKFGRYLADIEIAATGEDLATLLRDAGFEKRESYDD